MRSIYFLILSCFFLCFLVAQEIDEEAIFGKDSLVDSSSLANNQKISDKNKGVSFGGDIYNRSHYNIRRDSVTGDVPWRENLFFNYFQNDLFFDLRLDKGVKVYTSFSLFVYPSILGLGAINSGLRGFSDLEEEETEGASSSITDLSANNRSDYQLNFNELFIDFNLFYLVYFRIGKQVLQWSRGFFWTPADVINVDLKTFTDLDRRRLGVYGLRFSVPIGTLFNFYSFVSVPEDLGVDDDYSLALKGEMLLGKLEFGLSYWGKKGKDPIYAFDFSTGLLGFNIYGEGAYSLSHFNERAFLDKDDKWFLKRYERESFKMVLGFNKSFREGLNVYGGEIFYNGEGYSNKTILEDTDLKLLFLTQGGYYPLQHSQWYVSIFLTFLDLFTKTTTLNLNMALNIVDTSLILSPVVSFSPIQDFVFSLTPTLYLGSKDKEFTYANLGSSLVLDIKASF